MRDLEAAFSKSWVERMDDRGGGCMVVDILDLLFVILGQLMNFKLVSWWTSECTCRTLYSFT